MKQFRSFILLAVTGSFFFGCTPDPTFPVEPVLTYKEYRQTPGDSLVTVFSFTDGDGDIGLAPTDNDSNMVMTLYVPDANGIFRTVEDLNTPEPDSICYSYRIPHLTAGQIGLEGDIYLTVEHISFIGRDTLQFGAFLLDQSDHRSNYVRTKTIILTH
jgi:hypothetical protein